MKSAAVHHAPLAERDQLRVSCIMLTMPGREEFATRAVCAFNAQTYKNKSLCIRIDRGPNGPTSKTIGHLRNDEIQGARGEIILHWDDDDWSYPDRIMDQVRFLLDFKHDCTGYNTMLFWRDVPGGRDAEAWIYVNPDKTYCVGTSLCYWRRVWERHPFPDRPKARGATGEDTEWIRDVDSWAMPFSLKTPPMIAHIHGGNSMPYNIEELIAHGSTNWLRLQGKDEYCRRIMQL